MLKQTRLAVVSLTLIVIYVILISNVWFYVHTKEKIVEEIKVCNVDITAYSSHPSMTDKTPFYTSSQTNCRTGIIALSRDLLKEHNSKAAFSYGDTVYVILGPFIVEDTTNKRLKRRADIWLPSRKKAVKFGFLENATIIKH
jgi:3D (Asp-Asp-Asp) domain-containing protein